MDTISDAFSVLLDICERTNITIDVAIVQASEMTTQLTSRL